MNRTLTAATAAALILTTAPATTTTATATNRSRIITATTHDGMNLSIWANTSNRRVAHALANGRGQKSVTIRWRCGRAPWRSHTEHGYSAAVTLPKNGTCRVYTTGSYGWALFQSPHVAVTRTLTVKPTR